MEGEANDTLPFLDVLVMKRRPKLTTKVYRKPTHTGCYLHFKSNHPHHVKRGVVHSLVNWAQDICQKDFDIKIKNIRHDLTLNEYPKEFVAQQKKQCGYSIACDCGRCYIGETSRLLEVCIKEHKYNPTQGLLEKSKLAQHAYEESHKICWNEAKVCRLRPTTRTRNQSTCLCWTIRSVNPVWTFLPSGPPLSQQKSRNYNSIKCRLRGKNCFSCVGAIRSIASLQWWFQFSGARPHTCGVFNILTFSYLLQMVCTVFGLYMPSWRWHRCPKIGTSSIGLAQLSIFTWRRRRRQNPVSETLCFEK
jgi:hypothetical protein